MNCSSETGPKASRSGGLGTIFLVAVLLFATTSLPYLYWTYRADDAGVFVGHVGYHVGDWTNLGWLNQVRHGHVLLTYLYDTGAPDYVLINLHWLILGWTGRLLGLSLLGTFHLGRFLSTMVLVGVFGSWVIRRVKDRSARWVILLFFCFSGGFGWLFAVSSRILGISCGLPYDLLSWMYPFPEAFVTSHLPLSQALVLLTPLLLYRAGRRGGWADYLIAGLPAGALGWFHTYQVPTLCLGGLLYFVFADWRTETGRRRRLRRFLFFLPAAMTTGYMVYLRYTVPACGYWSGHVVERPSPWMLPIYLGPVLIITILCGRSQLRSWKDPACRAIGCFLAANLLLLYSPWTFPWIGNADIALFGLWLMWLVPCIGERWGDWRAWWRKSFLRRGLVLALFLTSFGSSALLWGYRGWVMPRQPDYRIPNDLYSLLQKVDSLTTPADVVIAEPGICTMVPAFADGRSLFGDASNTIAYEEKRRSLEDLLKSPSPERMMEIARRYNVTAWIVGPTHLPLPDSWTKVESSGDYTFVRVY